MKADIYCCWWCRKPVDGGVCIGPHPDYRPRTDRTKGNVSSVSGDATVTR